jgi:CubicO group peptidase (beta-lactamase class C family)
MRSFVKAILALGVGAAVLAGARSGAQSLDQPPRHPIPYSQFKHRLNPHPSAKPHLAKPAAKPATAAHPAQAIASPTRAAAPHPPAPPSAAALSPKPAHTPAKPAAAPPAAKPAPRPATPAKPAPVAKPSPAAAPAAAPTAATPLPPAELEAFVDGAVREAMERDHIAGVAVSVVQNGQVVLNKGYGFGAPGRVVDPNATLFRLGPVSSVFTWIAVLKEAEAGRMRLDAPINLYLPEALHLKDQGWSRPVLTRDLMTHSAGFADRSLGVQGERDPRRVRSLAQFLRQERPRQVREPGVLPTWSDYGVALAGEAVAFVENRPFPDLVEADITGPLGMARTGFREPYPARADLPAPMPAFLAADLSTGYSWRSGAFTAQPFEYLSQEAPADGASSTAGDMAKLMQAILSGGTGLYGPDTARALRTTTLAAAPGVAGLDSGFAEYQLPGGYRGVGADGGALWHHAAMVTVPDLNLGVFVADNTNTGGALTQSLPAAIVGRFYDRPPGLPRVGAPALVGQAAAYDGTFLSTRRAYGGLGLFQALLSRQIRIRTLGDGSLMIGADQPRAWVPSGADGRFVQTIGPQTSAFQMKDGRAVRWYAPSGLEAYDRIGPLWRVPTLALAAGLTALAALATLVGLFTRARRDFRQTPIQARAGQVQTAGAVLWLMAIACLVGYGWRSRDLGYLMYAWPTNYLLFGSALALVAALLSLVSAAMTPVIWRGGRRVDSWSGWRKARFTLTMLIFLGFSVLLGLWGALEPWSG